MDKQQAVDITQNGKIESVEQFYEACQYLVNSGHIDSMPKYMKDLAVVLLRNGLITRKKDNT